MLEPTEFPEDMLKILNDVVPSHISEMITKFCDEISPDTEPVFTPCKSEVFSQENDCFINVDKKIERDGGSVQLGWQIWRTGNFLLEAEFHAVWRSESGKLIDVTPKPIALERILFLPDNKKDYKGKQVKSILMNITGNSLIDDYISIFDAKFHLENVGSRAEQHAVMMNLREIQQMEFLQQLAGQLLLMVSNGYTKNSHCFCQSGNKYKHCHGKKLKKMLLKIL